MRKLTVKNFSVIQDAELEFGKITVLIGPQSSGKSLLCKLAYFLQYEIVLAAVDAIKAGQSWEEFETLVTILFSHRFHFESWAADYFLVQLELNDYLVAFQRATGNGNLLVRLRTSQQFKDLYSRHIQPSSSLQFNLRPEERLILAQNGFFALQCPSGLLTPVYIPAGRAFFTNNLGSAVMQNPHLDPVIRRFNAEISWNPTTWMPGLFVSDRRDIPAISSKMDKIAGGTVRVQGNDPVFEPFNRKPLPFSFLSSGTQELLPLFNVLNRLVYLYEHSHIVLQAKNSPQEITQRPWVYMEEPETHIFPKTQYEIIQLFSWLANDPILNFDWTITTHSPYILTAFNNLIEAWRVGNKPGKHDKAAAVIPEQYWIDEKDFKAYAIHDGKLIPIFKVETEGEEGSGLIDGNYLDSVSDELGSQFDELLDIEYAD